MVDRKKKFLGIFVVIFGALLLSSAVLFFTFYTLQKKYFFLTPVTFATYDTESKFFGDFERLTISNVAFKQRIKMFNSRYELLFYRQEKSNRIGMFIIKDKGLPLYLEDGFTDQGMNASKLSPTMRYSITLIQPKQSASLDEVEVCSAISKAENCPNNLKEFMANRNRTSFAQIENTMKNGLPFIMVPDSWLYSIYKVRN